MVITYVRVSECINICALKPFYIGVLAALCEAM